MLEPTNEAETIELFKLAQGWLGWCIVIEMRGFPDAVIENENGQRLAVEFEYRAKNFDYHKHDPGGCDLVVCWADDWPGASLPVWALQDSLPPGWLVWWVEQRVDRLERSVEYHERSLCQKRAELAAERTVLQDMKYELDPLAAEAQAALNALAGLG